MRMRSSVRSLLFAAGLCALAAPAARADGPPWWELSVQWAWLPGTLLGTIGGVWGGLAGTFAPTGRARTVVLGSGAILLAGSLLMLVLGIALLASGRSWALWYPWLLPGVIGSVLFAPLLPTVRRRYEQTEMRQLEARDIADT